MNLPVSWVVAGVIPASQLVTRTASYAATSASHFFGDLLQSNPSPTNPPQINPPKINTPQADSGRSVPIESDRSQKPNSEQRSWSDRVESLRTYLSSVVTKARGGYGRSSDSSELTSFSITANGKDQPVISGPEPLRTELEHHLLEHPAIVGEINELAVQHERSGPLRLLPSPTAFSNTMEAWKLWLGH